MFFPMRSANRKQLGGGGSQGGLTLRGHPDLLV